MLVNTTFMIDVMKNDATAVRKAEDLSGAATSILVGTPTVFELYVGSGLSVRSAEERKKVLGILRSLPHLPLDAASASKAGMIYAQRIKEKTKIDLIPKTLCWRALRSKIMKLC